MTGEANYSLDRPCALREVTRWSAETDVIVVGFGAAGASAAIEAARAGAHVALFEATSGDGGTSALSGGEIYLGGGGGTPIQRAAGFTDLTEDLYRYLLMAGGPNVDEAKVRLYAEGSLGHYEWLTAQGLEYKNSYISERTIEPSTDDWPFLYLRDRHIPRHYLAALALILVVSTAVVMFVIRGQSGTWSWSFFLLGAGFMLLETKSIIQFALLWGSTWVVASLAIAAVLSMALVANYVVSRVEVTRPWLVGGALLALLAVNFMIPVGAIAFESRALESLFYAVLMFSPILCAGLLFGSAIKRSTSLSRDYGTNLLGAMVGGVGEYLSLVTGFRMLLLVIALCYIGAIATLRRR